MGMSRQISIGPEGVVSLLVGGAINFEGSDQFGTPEERASALALMYGIQYQMHSNSCGSHTLTHTHTHTLSLSLSPCFSASFRVGLFTLAFGLLRVGFLDSLISRPILDGFVSASAAIIIIEQSTYQLEMLCASVPTD
jgi:MFS superfamily sulfate permease-like transporter